MPPPKPSTEGTRDRQVTHEIGQIVRALQAEGAQSPAALETLLGARFWEGDRFESALAFAIADGVVVSTRDGRLSAV
jgi:hypothetical protein